MSKPLDDGGPAFPQPQAWPMTNSYGGYGGGWYSAPTLMPIQQGMSLRDWLAGQALAVVASGSHESGTDFLHPRDYATCAHDAYAMADAMLAARTRRSEPEGE